jgi:hypothetical protein
MSKGRKIKYFKKQLPHNFKRHPQHSYSNIFYFLFSTFLYIIVPMNRDLVEKSVLLIALSCSQHLQHVVMTSPFHVG